MDTPDNNHKALPNSALLSKFEDSPVFNYISTLSPIKQFSLSHSSQSFHLNFASPQSLQTPPTINCPNVSNFKSANLAPDASMNNSSQDGSKGGTPEMLSDLQEDKLSSGKEVYVTTTNDSSVSTNELPIVKYECDSSKGEVVCSDSGKPDCEIKMVGMEVPPKIIQEGPKEGEPLPTNQIDRQIIEVEHNKEACEWEKFICETSGIFDCHSPTKQTSCEDDKCDDGSGNLSITDFLQPPDEKADDSLKMESLYPLNSSQNHGAAQNSNEGSQVSSFRSRAVFAEEVVHVAKTEVNDKSYIEEQQTTRRRCLIYEMSGSNYRKMLSDSTDRSPISNSAATPDTSNEKNLVASKPGNRKRSSSVLPGIGLHLNALAATGRDKIIVKRESLTCRRQLLSAPRTMSLFNSNNQETESLNPPLASEVIERTCQVQKDETSLNENACESSAIGDDIGIPPSSPIKKRKITDDIGEGDSCKRCNCKRTKCLKLYCECFAAGLYCVEPCNCQNCLNKPSHEDTVLETRRQIESRNPLAFAPKVIMCSDTPKSLNELNKTPASARHKRGCNCKKSGCLKKYCECFQGGVGCSISCRCEGCKNTFGRKEGNLFQEASISHKCASAISPHDEFSQRDHEKQGAAESSNAERQPVKQHFHLQRGQVLKSCTTQKTDNSDHTATVDEKQDPVLDDEASEALEGDYLIPNTSVKSTSPNCKRILSRHPDIETSPDWKSCRKLILRSIPTLSSVPNEQESSKLHGKLQ